jgi:hydroxyacylglutathione hydrolase
MSRIQSFTFNPFQENTYIIFDESKECIIIDPGCFEDFERKYLVEFIENNKLTPVMLINTHCHIDHILGNKFVSEKYNLPVTGHREDIYNLESLEMAGKKYGVPVEPSPAMTMFLEEGDGVKFGNTIFSILHTPGHSLGSITLYNSTESFAIVGDVIFRESIGRADLPGGDFAVLEKTIKDKIYALPDDTQLYSGHGPKTNVGYEKRNNPFVKG